VVVIQAKEEGGLRRSWDDCAADGIRFASFGLTASWLSVKQTPINLDHFAVKGYSIMVFHDLGSACWHSGCNLTKHYRFIYKMRDSLMLMYTHTQWSVKALISALPGHEDLSGWAGITQGGSGGKTEPEYKNQ